MSNTLSDVLDCYLKAGHALADIRKQVTNIVKEGMPIIELCKKIESLIREKGCEVAFPCNVDINEIAAHYTSPPRDLCKIPFGSIVKVDLGAHVDGYVADSAVTVNFNPQYEDMVFTLEEALLKAIKAIRSGVKISTISSIIEKTIKEHGYKPIKNLCGHSISRYTIHSGTTIPNINMPLSIGKFKADNVYAIEPFLTTKNAAGEVINSEKVIIYRLRKFKSTPDASVRRLYEFIKTKYRSLPFTPRWLTDRFPSKELDAGFATLLSSKVLEAYPVLVERTGKVVAQAEHTVVVTNDENLVIT